MVSIGVGIVLLIIGVLIWYFGGIVIMNQITGTTTASNDDVTRTYKNMFDDDSVPYTNFQTERIFDDQNKLPEGRVTVL